LTLFRSQAGAWRIQGNTIPSDCISVERWTLRRRDEYRGGSDQTPSADGTGGATAASIQECLSGPWRGTLQAQQAAATMPATASAEILQCEQRTAGGARDGHWTHEELEASLVRAPGARMGHASNASAMNALAASFRPAPAPVVGGFDYEVKLDDP